MQKAIAIIMTCLLLVSCKSVNDYRVSFLNAPCIIPFHRYSYFTCDQLNVLINGKPITIPKHFSTDLASIPRFYWAFSSPSNSDFMAASILHDYLYRCTTSYTREDADNIFYYALRSHGVSGYTSFKMYAGVRLFGARNFDPQGNCLGPSNASMGAAQAAITMQDAISVVSEAPA